MLLKNGTHLGYCTNIHAGESWNEVLGALQKNIPSIKKEISPGSPFGIGLRLGDAAAKEVLSGNNLLQFKSWLKENDLYVFTINGFPYGNFHHGKVKEEVYKPDWTTNKRLLYSLNLISVLEQLMEENSETGFSTSPLSYKYWTNTDCDSSDVMEACCINLIKCVERMHAVRERTGKYIHLDIEPEPDCLLENSQETIDFFDNYLLPYGKNYLKNGLKVNAVKAEQIIKDHITVCYDVCHFAVEFEEPKDVISKFTKAGIKIGKVQISSALKVMTGKNSDRQKIKEAYSEFAESTYLHQTVAKSSKGDLIHFRDLPEALEQFDNPDLEEWRTHYHVPVFMQSYHSLKSTQEDIIKVAELMQKEKFTNRLEVETYTWEVLPPEERLPLNDSIVRELKWTREVFDKK